METTMDQPLKRITLQGPDGSPQSFILPRRWRWAACPLPDLEGLRVEVRTNLTHAEAREMERQFADFDDLFVAMAPHVRAWNVGTIDAETDEPRVVAPPAVAGPGAFFQVPEAVAVWIRRCLLDRTLDRAPVPAPTEER
ncbi:MAG: hypothetical protein M3Q71_02680 [Chloroflexota bacterium]|nr:hypothetical protein [Chloroflexota bacterium]